MLSAIKENVVYVYNNAVDLIVKAKAYLFGREVEQISPVAGKTVQPTKADVAKAQQKFDKLKASLVELNTVVQTERKKLNALARGDKLKYQAQQKIYQNALTALNEKTAEMKNFGR